MKVSDVTKNGLKLKWEKPEDDGGLPITSYQIEKLDKATGRWVPVGRAGPSDTEMDVKGLQEGHEYEFRVKAINEEGESEPLVTDSSTIAKNPYGERDAFCLFLKQKYFYTKKVSTCAILRRSEQARCAGIRGLGRGSCRFKMGTAEEYRWRTYHGLRNRNEGEAVA